MKTGWYAGLMRDSSRRALLLGPYRTKRQASANVTRAHEGAEAVDPFCHFDTPGVFKLQHHTLPAGRLNDRLGLLA